MRKLEKDYWKHFPAWKNVPKSDWENWKWQIRNRIKSVSQLEEILGVNLPFAEKVEKVFRTGTTPYYLSLVKDLSNLDNPILKQIVPSLEEINPEIQSEGSLDPFNEEFMSPVKGLTHRYPDRVLFRVTTFCSVYCRHCMRKRIFLEEERAKRYEDYLNMIEYIKNNSSIKEVLISGGDPLTLPNKKLKFILEHLSNVKHLEVIRIGTRELVVNPYRFFDEGLLKLLEKYEKVWIVTHFNHSDEVTDIVKKAVRNILSTGTPVLNQAVLLKGINDTPETIENLMRSLLQVKIKPYYLFYCDPTKGVLHFRTDIKKGVEILEYLRRNLSGIGIPVYAVDLPGGLGKIPLTSEYLLEETEEYLLVKSPQGKTVKMKRHNFDIINNYTKD